MAGTANPALSFHRQSDKLERWRNLLTVLVVLATVAGLVALLLTPDRGVSSYSPGPVSSAHAAWETQCWQCHADFAPQRADAVDFGAPDAQQSKWGRAADRQCRKCHQVEGLDSVTRAEAHPYPIAQHSLRESPQAVVGCAACHREHPPNGREGNILAVADRQCIRCHQDLQNFMSKAAGTTSSCQNEITRFDVDHPPFRSLKEAGERPIKFSHQRHMAIGLRISGERRELPPFRLADIAPGKDRDAYRSAGQSDDQPVQLDCASCHSAFAHSESQAEGGSLAATRHERHISLPNYEQHCKACHRLDYEPGSTDPGKVVEHGLSPTQIREFLVDKYSGAGEQREALFVEPLRLRRPLPGTPPNEATGKDDRAAAESAVSRAEAHLRKRCFQCHRPPADGDPRLPEVRDVPWSKSTNAPVTILRESQFSHKAHAFARIDCTVCHSLLGRSKTMNSADAADSVDRRGSDITIPDIDNCKKCHSSRVAKTAIQASTNCVTCHRYHRAANTAANRQIADRMLSKALAVVQRGATESSPATSQRPPDLAGAVSCAAAGCHGGNWLDADEIDDEAWKTSYTAWIRRDPHAGAYDALWNDRSKQMVRLLSPQPLTASAYQQYIEQRCIGCHSTTPRNDPTHELWLADGVSCESCHGPAHKWGVAHTLSAWRKPSGELKATAGFVDNTNLTTRVEQCVKCHIGFRDIEGRRYEVNHDLIAAGHPRLRFEYAAYMANLPPHWNTTREQKEHETLEVKLWSIGQTVSAREALRQLESRADAAAKGAGRSVWPELAEYACDSCHHDLESPSYRQKPGVRNNLGNLAWGTWYFPEIGESLRTKMSGLSTGAAEALENCPSLRTAIERPRDSLAELRAAVLRSPPARWDDLAQWYLAAAALVEHLDSVDRFAGRPIEKDQIGAALAELFQSLDYPFVGSASGKTLQRCVACQQELQKLLSDRLKEDSGE